MLEVLKNGKSGMKNSKYGKIVSALQWRQAHLKSEIYPIELEDGRVLEIKQIGQGETKGIGTGATLWPAAHVLSKYIEKSYATDETFQSKRVIDIGSGTGCTGFAAAAFGADVTLTDQEQVLFLMHENKLSICHANTTINPDKIHIELYDWGEPCGHLNPPFDIVLVSDCVLPKLYPIEPLVEVLLILQLKTLNFQTFS
jgi:hypothetical protein